MFIKAFLAAEKWQHQVNRRSPVLSLQLTPSDKKSATCFVVVDDVTCFFMATCYFNGVMLYYSMTENTRSGFAREEGEFNGFDSVSAEFHGIRFHWSRESGKVVITDAVARQREFDTLKIE